MCGKTMENLRKRINVRLVWNKKDYLIWTSKQCYMSQKTFEKDLVAIRKITVTLTLNKPAHVGMCMLDLIKVLMCECNYDYIKINTVTIQDYYSLTLIVWCVKLGTSFLQT